MPWMVPTGPEDYARLIEEVGRERFAVHMDIINMTNSLERYYGAEKFIDRCVELLGSKIRSCHIKDVHLKEEYTFVRSRHARYSGTFNYRRRIYSLHELP